MEIGQAEAFTRIWEGKKCSYKTVIEECLFPTGSDCEVCDGYDYICKDYKPGIEQEKKDEK